MSHSVDGEDWPQAHSNNSGPSHTRLPAAVTFGILQLAPFWFPLVNAHCIKSSLQESDCCSFHHENVNTCAKSWLLRLMPGPLPPDEWDHRLFPKHTLISSPFLKQHLPISACCSHVIQVPYVMPATL